MKALRMTRGRILALVAVIIVAICAACLPALHGETVYISGSLVKRDIDDLFEKSSLAVIGTVTGQSEAFQIEHVSGGVRNFTDYYFTIENTLRGSAETQTVTIRIQGGTVDDYTEIFEHSPDLKLGEEYLVFLYKPGRGGNYNTEGDYYYILGQTQGVFTQESSGDFVSATGVRLTSTMMVSTINDEPVNENYFREEYIANQQRNLQNGFITQEEYDELMDNIDQYATVVENSN